MKRWTTKIGPTLRPWLSLSDDEQQRYQDFVDIGAAQLAIVTINFSALLSPDPAVSKPAIELANQLVNQAQAAVAARV